MSFTLHYAKTYKVEYARDYSFGNWKQAEVNELLHELCPDMWQNDDYYYSEDIEISKDELREAIRKLREEYNDTEPLGWMLKDGISYNDIADFLQAALDGADKDNDFVRFAWF